VLYIDDDPPSSVLMRAVVAVIPNSRFLTSTRGDLGVEIAATQRPDLIILDIRLPDMSGYDVLERLKAAPETAGIPVFALSADALPADVEKGRTAGFHRYITKPFAMGDMLQALSDVAASTVN
jgi:CheY-like chemotaxis protein